MRSQRRGTAPSSSSRTAAAQDLTKDDAMGSGGGPRRSRGGPAEDAEPGRRDVKLPAAAGAARGRVAMELAPSGSVRTWRSNPPDRDEARAAPWMKWSCSLLRRGEGRAGEVRRHKGENQGRKGVGVAPARSGMRRSGQKAARSSLGGVGHGGYKASFDAMVQKPPDSVLWRGCCRAKGRRGRRRWCCSQRRTGSTRGSRGCGSYLLRGEACSGKNEQRRAAVDGGGGYVALVY